MKLNINCSDVALNVADIDFLSCSMLPKKEGQEQPNYFRLKLQPALEPGVPTRWLDERVLEINEQIYFYLRQHSDISLTTLHSSKISMTIALLEKLGKAVLPYHHIAFTVPAAGLPYKLREEHFNNTPYQDPVTPEEDTDIRKIAIETKTTAFSVFISKDLQFKDRPLFSPDFFKRHLPEGYTLPVFDMEQYNTLDLGELSDPQDNYFQLWIDADTTFKDELSNWNIYILAVKEETNSLELVPIRYATKANSGAEILTLPLLIRMIAAYNKELYTKQDILDLSIAIGQKITEAEFKDNTRKDRSKSLADVPLKTFYDTGLATRAATADGELKQVLNKKQNLFLNSDAYNLDEAGNRIANKDLKLTQDMISFATNIVLPAAITWIENNRTAEGIKPCLKKQFIKNVLGSNEDIPEYIIYKGEKQKSGQWEEVERALNILKQRYLDIKENAAFRALIKTENGNKLYENLKNPSKAAILYWEEADNADNEKVILFFDRPIIYRLSVAMRQNKEIPATWTTWKNLKSGTRSITFSRASVLIVNLLAKLIYTMNQTTLSKEVVIDKFLEDCGLKTENEQLDSRPRSRYVEVVIAKLEGLKAYKKIKDYSVIPKGLQKVYAIKISFARSSKRTELEDKATIAEDKQHKKAEKIRKTAEN